MFLVLNLQDLRGVLDPNSHVVGLHKGAIDVASDEAGLSDG